MDTIAQHHYRTYPPYLEASPAAREAIDAAQAALAKVTAPRYGLDRTAATGELGLSFTWHDGAQYRLTLNKGGEYLRLFRLQYTGRMIDDGEEDGILTEDVVWRTVRAFSKDRAGKVLAARLGDRPASPAWVEAASK